MNVERNVVYGMYSGLALLMDVYRPDQPNGYGIVHISGSGWSAPLGLDARPLKASAHVEIEALPLVEAALSLPNNSNVTWANEAELKPRRSNLMKVSRLNPLPAFLTSRSVAEPKLVLAFEPSRT